MSRLFVPLCVAVPLGVAALLAAVGTHLPRYLPDGLAVGTTAGVTAMLLVVLLESGHRSIVYWFGAWHPRHGFALGVRFVVDPLAAAAATLAAVAVLAALAFAWGHFEPVRHLFHSLMLVFLAGMVGFVCSGDLFNLFVFLELMSVAGYALCAYRVDLPKVIQGAANFAVLNSGRRSSSSWGSPFSTAAPETSISSGSGSPCRTTIPPAWSSPPSRW